MPHVKELEKDFQVIVPDLRGHGKSSPDLSGFSFEKTAQDVFALMDYLKIQKMKGAGHTSPVYGKYKPEFLRISKEFLNEHPGN